MYDEIESLLTKLKDYVDLNLPYAIEHYKSVFKEYRSQDYMKKSSISIVDHNQNQIG